MAAQNPSRRILRASGVQDRWMSTSVHPLRPLGLLAAAWLLVEGLGVDRAIAHALFFDAAAGRWLGEGSWWARDLLHGGGRWLVRGVAAGALLAFAASFVAPQCRPARRAAGFVWVAIVLPVALVGALKALTNVDCPWELAEFGGSRPFIGLFGDRPDYLPTAQCFPGAHSSSGFALLCFHFLWCDNHPRRARWALWAGCALGILFAFGQEARGAHFLSHDLASGILVWAVQYALYRRLIAPRPALQEHAGQRIADHPRGEATENVA